MDEARERRRLIAAYDKTKNLNFLRAAKCLDRGSKGLDKADILLASESRKTRGNPKIDDYDALVGMGILMELDGLSQRGAALQMASERPGLHSEEATAKRLDRKFREKPDEYLWFARQIASALDRQRRFDVLVRSIEKSSTVFGLKSSMRRP